MERTFPATTARAASQVVCHAGSDVGNFGRGVAAGLDLASAWANRLVGIAVAPAASAVCFRKSLRSTLFMRTSVRPVFEGNPPFHDGAVKGLATRSNRLRQ